MKNEQERYKSIIAVHIFLLQGQEVLLLKRENTGFGDGKYSVIAGHLEPDEWVQEAAQREALEEAGVTVQREHLQIVGIMHRQTKERRMDFFFATNTWSGEIRNMEPSTCSELQWFPLENIPENTVEYIKRAIHNYTQGIFYDEFVDPIAKAHLLENNMPTVEKTEQISSTEESQLKHIDKEAIMNVLKDCYDPEIPMNIVDLGLVQDIDINGFTGDVQIVLTPTSMGCPSIPEFIAEIEQKVRALPEVATCKVELSFNPPWTPDRMTDEAKWELGMM